MRTFAIITAISLAVLAAGIYNISKAEKQPYSLHLRDIAIGVNSMKTTWKAGLPSRFADIEDVSQIQRHLGTIIEEVSSLPDISEYHTFDMAAVPDSFDSRTAWPKCDSIKEVRDQSSCGSSWAFGVVEAISDRICIHSGQKLQTRVSSEDLITCCTRCGKGCNGGSSSNAWEYWMQTGIVSGNLYTNDQMTDSKTCRPYAMPPCAHHTTNSTYQSCTTLPNYDTPKCEKTCNSLYKANDFNNDKSKGMSNYSVHGEYNMKAEISRNGPIEVSVAVYEDFETYTGGVYQHVTGKYLGGHSMKCIGYGTDPKTNQKYWLVTNSLNETWGENGYIRILRGVNEIGIENKGSAGMPLLN